MLQNETDSQLIPNESETYISLHPFLFN